MNYLADLRAVELEILSEVLRICKKHSIQYYLLGGTLLGAVRHQGFIPWDDDIDISMPRKDYNRFLRIASKELDSKYFLQCYFTDERHCLRHSKIRKNNTLFIEDSNTRDMSSHHGIFIDIFPLDYAHRNDGIQTFQRKLAVLCEIMIMIKQDDTRKGIKKWICKLFSYKFLHTIQNISMSLVKNGDYIVSLASKYDTSRETFPANYYSSGTYLKFETYSLCVPLNYDGVLRTVFGDNYMELPPLENRESHFPTRLSFDTNGPDAFIEN